VSRVNIIFVFIYGQMTHIYLLIWFS